jgi:hypothetical protein
METPGTALMGDFSLGRASVFSPFSGCSSEFRCGISDSNRSGFLNGRKNLCSLARPNVNDVVGRWGRSMSGLAAAGRL